MTVSRRAIGKNEIRWLVEGAGAHGADPKTPDEVAAALDGKFRFVAATDGAPGLRAPQLGALHAVLAARTTEADEAMTVVMPTGTGKTETMLAVFAYEPKRMLIMVPSNALRTQIAEKFVRFGILPEAGVIGDGFLAPVVGLLKSGLQTVADVDALIDVCSVVVATSASLTHCSTEAIERIAERIDQLVIDEAHHVAARTWRSVAEAFGGKPILQFTATPFREDGQYMGGRVRYAYPLRLAQRDGYFATINYRAITDLGDVDRTLAAAAVEQLRADVAEGRDHIVMARVQSIPRADEVLSIYEAVAPDLTPVRIDSKMSQKRQRESLALLANRTSWSSCAWTCLARASIYRRSRSRPCTILTRASR